MRGQGKKCQRKKRDLIHIDLSFKRWVDFKQKMTLASHFKQRKGPNLQLICSCLNDAYREFSWVFKMSLLERWRLFGRSSGPIVCCGCGQRCGQEGMARKVKMGSVQNHAEDVL